MKNGGKISKDNYYDFQINNYYDFQIFHYHLQFTLVQQLRAGSSLKLIRYDEPSWIEQRESGTRKRQDFAKNIYLKGIKS